MLLPPRSRPGVVALDFQTLRRELPHHFSLPAFADSAQALVVSQYSNLGTSPLLFPWQDTDPKQLGTLAMISSQRRLALQLSGESGGDWLEGVRNKRFCPRIVERRGSVGEGSFFLGGDVLTWKQGKSGDFCDPTNFVFLGRHVSAVEPGIGQC